LDRIKAGFDLILKPCDWGGGVSSSAGWMFPLHETPSVVVGSGNTHPGRNLWSPVDVVLCWWVRVFGRGVYLIV
jgi:hypothetical protein